jgi:hypothetical protein
MAANIHQFRKPEQCVYWNDPESVRRVPMKDFFELIDTYASESHLRRYLLKCRECGQLYFFEFYESIDWENGNDPQYSKFIPVATMDDAEMLKNASPGELPRFSPSLNIDFPKDAEAPTVYWVGKFPPAPVSALQAAKNPGFGRSFHARPSHVYFFSVRGATGLCMRKRSPRIG